MANPVSLGQTAVFRENLNWGIRLKRAAESCPVTCGYQRDTEKNSPLAQGTQQPGVGNFWVTGIWPRNISFNSEGRNVLLKYLYLLTGLSFPQYWGWFRACRVSDSSLPTHREIEPPPLKEQQRLQTITSGLPGTLPNVHWPPSQEDVASSPSSTPCGPGDLRQITSPPWAQFPLLASLKCQTLISFLSCPEHNRYLCPFPFYSSAFNNVSLSFTPLGS